MSDPKRPDETENAEAPETLQGEDAAPPREDSVEDAEVVAQEDAPRVEADSEPETPEDEVKADDETVAEGELRDDETPHEAEIPDEAETPEESDARVAPVVASWGGAAANIHARSTSDPSSPDYEPPVHEAAEPSEEYVDEHDHDEGGSVAGRILFWLFLLAAGGVLVLWGGPRVAPHLPAGMEPVAEWLTPGRRAAQMQVEDMEARLNARIDALDTGLTPAGVTAQIDGAVAESEALTADNITALTTRVQEVSDQVAAADSEAIEARLGQVEVRLDGLAGELAALQEQISGLAEGELGVVGANAEQIGAFDVRLAGLRAELDRIAAQNGELNQRIDEVAATAERQVREAEEQIATARAEAEAEVARASEQTDMIAIAGALDTGEPYADALAGIAELAEVPEGLAAHAETGVPTQAQLVAGFAEPARAAVRADVAASEEDGVFGSASAFFRSRVSGRSLVEIEGDGADAILSRVEARLREGNLDAALEEASALPPPAAAELQTWFGQLQARAQALGGYRMLVERLDAVN
ncbi:COG4223 family protein [Pontivivens ytuae]|uniref:Uncharacterized protein n=1 Tax=Pontivivens ytuae TaxID=2789856 RepID=A0A7S9LU73_9RHOB|nr:hypothetical protein [Pontivivens ytuae]QPH55344.1 hypothetical protein I0K15_06285 [Pontivivens ytuae]